MSFEASLEAFSALVMSEDFKQKQVAFFERYCMEFDGADENKLAYTTIHKQYEAQIEAEIQNAMGPDQFAILVGGLEAFQQAGRSVETEASAEAINVLDSLADFQAFKATMLAKKNTLSKRGQTALETFRGSISIEGALDRTAELAAAATDVGGWTLVLEEPNCVFYTKPGPDGATYLRYTITGELAPAQMFDCFINASPESVFWRDKVKSIEVLQDYGPYDKVVLQEMELPWAIRYIMSMPDKMAFRMAGRRGFPTENDYSYAIVPFDVENNVCLESQGNLKIKSGVISPHSENPSQCTLTGMDLLALGMVPSWGLGFLLKKMSLPAIASMCEKYKKALAFDTIRSINKDWVQSDQLLSTALRDD